MNAVCIPQCCVDGGQGDASSSIGVFVIVGVAAVVADIAGVAALVVAAVVVLVAAIVSICC